MKCSGVPRAFLVSGLASFVTAVYEVTKAVCYPRLSMAQSHVATVVFAGVIAFALSFLMRTFAERMQTQYQRLFDSANDAILVFEPQSETILDANAAASRLYGIQKHELIGSTLTRFTKDVAAGKQHIRELLEKESTSAFESIHLTSRREEISVLINSSIIHFRGRKAALSVVRDITERKTLEQKLHQAQKMEAIGRLAGGVAHDFNNILGVITGHSELLKERPGLEEIAFHHIDQIHLAAKKAASLTQQLLAFSRKQTIQPRIFDVNQTIGSLSKMLQRLIGDGIQLSTRLCDVSANIKADPGQIEQVIMNLAVNGRDAMPDGGHLIIETAICDLDNSYAENHQPVKAGRYVQVAITDTGTGIDKDTMSHLFEPFFTTKELGRGTGLGLSIVYGIVKQAEGYIWVYSEPGHGTCFKLYFPLRAEEVDTKVAPTIAHCGRGNETVLVVEDDEGFRNLIAGYLRNEGYKVVQSSSGREALEQVSQQKILLDVLITDITMPGMNGRDLADVLSLRFQKLKIIYMSGYTHNGVVQTRNLKPEEVFLQKPFRIAELSASLRSVLASTSKQSQAHAGA